MRWQAIGLRMLFLLGVAAAGLSGPLSGEAQAQQNQGQGQGGFVAGVIFDADGVVKTRMVSASDNMLMRQRLAAAQAALPPEIRRFSTLRKVSVNRLEQAVRDSGGVVTDEMKYMAGLLRVQYVFYYPKTGDIVLAGPAEGWVTDPAGRVVGLNSGRPVLRLEDLVVALRAFPPSGQKTQVIGCSIDPTQEGLAALQQFLRSVPSNVNANPAQFAQWVTPRLRASLGMQRVGVLGVSPRTHYAQVLVEADYRMKLIAIGLERPPVRMVSFIDAATPSHVSRNALFRWYFVPDYECVRIGEDGLAMELVGDGVKLIGEDELVTQTGERQSSSGGNRASQAFVTSFTKTYPELAVRSPVYAELRNLIDLAVTAAYIRNQGLYDKSGWNVAVFGSEQAFPVETNPAPQQVDSTVAAVFKRGRLMTPIGGGVHIEAEKALASPNLLEDEGGKVAKLRKEVTLDLAEGQWWWD